MMKHNKLILSLVCMLLCVFYVSDACADADQIFTTMGEKTGNFAQGLRKIALVMGAFGIVMFTFLAICGKINFKHLGYITICLFFLSGTAALIEYITTDGGKKIELPTEFTNGDKYEAASRL